MPHYRLIDLFALLVQWDRSLLDQSPAATAGTDGYVFTVRKGYVR
jgi:hypothetical protein